MKTWQEEWKRVTDPKCNCEETLLETCFNDKKLFQYPESKYELSSYKFKSFIHKQLIKAYERGLKDGKSKDK